MAVAQRGVLVAPSTDTRTLAQLNSTKIEAGLYQCNESRTITCQKESITSDKWSVLCISSEMQSNLHCYAQIWIPCNSSVSTNLTAFIRYSASGTSWSAFRALLTDRQAVQNNSAGDVRLAIGTSQPAAVSGATIVWLDTNG